MVFTVETSHQQQQVTASTYEHTSTDMKVSAYLLLVWKKIKVLNTNPSRLTKCTIHTPL